MRDEKQKICDKLAETIKMTRGANDLTSLTIDEKEVFVTAKFNDGRTKRICVEADSGLAMVYDIVTTLYEEVL